MTAFVKGLYITSNVASLFPREDHVFDNYCSCLKDQILEKEYHFVAIHFQEMGRKADVIVEECVEFLNDLRKTIFDDFPHAISMIDSSFEEKNSYTALCNIYVWRDIRLHIYNFKTSQYQHAEDVSKQQFIYTYNRDVIHSKHYKYGLDMLPYGKNSRKGFTITSFHFGKKRTAFSLINLHLVHDVNFELSPTDGELKFCANFRKKEYDMIESELINLKINNAILLGDFNFRTNEQLLIKELNPDFLMEVDEDTKVTKFKENNSEKTIATVTEKGICLDEEYYPNKDRIPIYIKSDTEGEIFLQNKKFYEFKRDFAPTYCFEKKDDGSQEYVKNRIPSYCDRIIIYGKKLIKTCVRRVKQNRPPRYFVLGENVFLSDHRPVCAELDLRK